MPQRKNARTPRSGRILTFQTDDDTDKALDLIASTIEGAHANARRSAAIRKAIHMAATQIAGKVRS